MPQPYDLDAAIAAFAHANGMSAEDQQLLRSKRFNPGPLTATTPSQKQTVGETLWGAQVAKNNPQLAWPDLQNKVMEGIYGPNWLQNKHAPDYNFKDSIPIGDSSMAFPTTQINPLLLAAMMQQGAGGASPQGSSFPGGPQMPAAPQPGQGPGGAGGMMMRPPMMGGGGAQAPGGAPGGLSPQMLQMMQMMKQGQGAGGAGGGVPSWLTNLFGGAPQAMPPGMTGNGVNPIMNGQGLNPIMAGQLGGGGGLLNFGGGGGG